MSRFAPVVPIQIARRLKEIGHLGGYHLLLAHDVVDKPETYKEVYGDLDHRTLILDNSLVELGRPMTFEEMQPAVKLLNPEYVVLPDILNDSFGTLDLAEEFQREIAHLHASILFYPDLAGVIQGRSLSECMLCARVFVKSLRVDMLCVPRVLVETLGTRVCLVQMLGERYPDIPIHLLGFSNSLLDDVNAARKLGVTGIDSAVPIRAALKGMSMSLSLPLFDPGPRGNYWEAPQEFVESKLPAIVHQITTYRGWINDAYS